MKTKIKKGDMTNYGIAVEYDSKRKTWLTNKPIRFWWLIYPQKINVNRVKAKQNGT